jgi:CheY-like chemotaxis protein
VRNTAYDLILMDVHMPDLDGLEAAAQIRARAAGGHRNVPIIAVTADVMRGDRERFLAAGMNDHIAKPFDYRSLAEVVRRWAGQRVTSLDTDGPAADAKDDA